MIAWMQNWETSSSKNEELQFCGMMTVPRELSIRNGKLCQNPVRELEKYRGLKIDYYNVHINNETSLYGINGNCIDLTVTIKPGNDKNMYKWFRIYLGKDGEHYTLLRFRPDISTIKVDRTRSGFPHDIVNIREFPVRQIDGNLKIRFIIDRYSMEMFVNDGEQAASFVLYAPVNAEAISFSCEGSSVIDIEKYDLLKEV
jgi:beta-fructofuranosidase